MLKILGYPDRYSVAPGETIAFMVSVEDAVPFTARLVRVIHGDDNPDGPGVKLPPVPSAIDGTYPGVHQPIHAGSHMRADGVPPLSGEPSGFTFFATIWPTRPTPEPQVLAAQWGEASGAGFALMLIDGGLACRLGDGNGRIETIRVDRATLKRKWYRVMLAVDPAAGTLSLMQRPILREAFVEDDALLTAPLPFALPTFASAFHLAGAPRADGVVVDHYDGKIEAPMLLGGAPGLERYERLLLHPWPAEASREVIAAWDFSREISTTRAVDIGPHGRDGVLVNLPARAMKGWNWTGEWHDWRQRPEHYGAVHFHHDDLYDAGWAPSFSLTVPDDLPSAAYAVHVSCGESEPEASRDYLIPFFVRPPRAPAAGRNRPKVAFLAPTASYIAYANHGEHVTAREAERTIGRLLQFGHADVYLHDHPELGGSLYDTHLDGSGVCYSSRLRPVLNCSPHYLSWLGGHGSGLWQYNADTHLLDWLDHQGVSFDVITDEDLHDEGQALLDGYRVVLTGTHPEYHSTPMWDAMRAWLDRGGRLMYLGADGWYWRIAFHAELPGVIEVRRAEDGIRTWAAEPGEYHHSFNGELGGLWRRVGRPPNLMVAQGFVAQGFDVSSYYRRAPDADDLRAAFIFEGVPDEIIGDFGLVGGGAAGLELDCIAHHLGSPRNTLRLATSEGHSSLVMLVNEEFGVVPTALGGDLNPKVRADLAFAELHSGGAVFGVGSIAWCGSLSHNGYDNNVSRITWNVLQRFMDEAPLA